ncbi:leucine/isoleucine/valine transporter subunit; membrane component of ABC superfamily [Nostocoides japonicum T1-X7]|uniref:Leucine/isoleucine/valine transporter subunit membrane component of ABC superfamily n=1 Tax=Nostocoides japonicum T1-X7 TaxID=1194083 RepID=A0A077M7M2_9MICO|nr:branched-chain amino acid ABC transporter permease [Tetrasphaera japonica]CCH80070.1 leucine/isoleucine/valine transporter subunit; membrane component of ABC superfamily [Tetrasphaera japonica T1-X7]
MTDFLNYLILGLTRGSMYALIALGYTLVYGVLQLINFAHSEVFMSGAFGSYLVVSGVVGSHHNLPWYATVGVLLIGLGSGAAVGAFVAWALERVAYRPLRERGAPKLAFLISAIGASFFLSQLAGKLFNRLSQNQFPTYFNANGAALHIGGASVSWIQLIVIVSALVLMIGLDRLVNGTKLGSSIRGVAEDAPTAALMGIDIDKTISRTFIIGGALGGAAGFLFGTAFVFSNTMGFIPGVKAFAAAVLGGIGNIRGAMIGGLLLGVVENLVPTAPWNGGQAWIGIQWTDVVAFVVLILVLVLRPTGILGEKLGRAA